MGGAQKDVTVDTKTYRSVKLVLTNKKKKFIEKLVNELTTLKEHNAGNISQFRRIKEVRRIVNDPSMNAVAVRMDWSENAKLFQCRQEKSNYYFDIQVAVNTAAVYQCNDSVVCVGSLSDNTDHTKPAVWVTLKAMLSVSRMTHSVATSAVTGQR